MAKHRLVTPEYILKEKTQDDIWEEEAEKISFIKNHMSNEFPDLSEIKVKPEFMRSSLFGAIRPNKLTWKDLEIIAHHFNLDISSFKKCEEKAEAISYLRQKVKEMDI